MRRIPKGFTLIELMVVIAIIAILFAILIPTWNKARRMQNTGTPTVYTNRIEYPNGKVIPFTSVSSYNKESPVKVLVVLSSGGSLALSDDKAKAFVENYNNWLNRQ